MKFLPVILCLFSSVVSAQSGDIYKNNFSGALVLSVEGGVAIGNTDIQDTKSGFSGGGIIEYFVPGYSSHIFGIRLQGSLNTIQGPVTASSPGYKTNIYSAGIGVTYIYSINNIVFPYIYGGISYLNFLPGTPSGLMAPNRARLKYETSVFAYNN